jgi:hypothetical protein
MEQNMKPQFPYGLTIVLAIFFFGPLPAIAQSTSVQAPLSVGPNYRVANSGLSLIPGEKISVALTPTMRRMEEILAGSPTIESKIRTSVLLERLQSMGFPVVLDPSAIDDELNADTVLEFELPNHTLALRLELALAKFNSCIQLYPDHARILSKDFEDDPEYFTTLTYDVSNIASWEDRNILANTIRQSVTPDGWTQTGTGDQTIMFSVIGGKNLMVISAPWASHVQVRQLLAQLTSLGGIGPTRRIASRQNSTRGQPTASTPVELPTQNVQRTPFQFNQSSKNMSGMSGGLKGGAFSVPGG